MHAAATSVRCIYIQVLQAFVRCNFIFPLQNQGCIMLGLGAQQLPQSAETVPKSFSLKKETEQFPLKKGTESRLRIHSES